MIKSIYSLICRFILVVFMAFLLLYCVKPSRTAKCDYDNLDKVALLDTIISKNLSNLPPIFKNKPDNLRADSIDVKSLSGGSTLIVSQYSFSVSELFFFVVEGECLNLEGYGTYFTRRIMIDKVVFHKVSGTYLAEITGRERISSNYPTPFTDTLALNLDGLNN